MNSKKSIIADQSCDKGREDCQRRVLYRKRGKVI